MSGYPVTWPKILNGYLPKASLIQSARNQDKIDIRFWLTNASGG